MKTKHKILISFIFLLLSIMFVAFGILLFNSVPEISTYGYENPKDALMMTGTFFSFFFGFACFVGCIGFLIYSFFMEE